MWRLCECLYHHHIIIAKGNFVNFWHENDFVSLLCCLSTVDSKPNASDWRNVDKIHSLTLRKFTGYNVAALYTIIVLMYVVLFGYIDDSLQLRQQYYANCDGTVMITWLMYVCMSDILVQVQTFKLQWKSTKIAGYLLRAETMV